MQPTNIQGVKYIGNKTQKEDNVCNTGAVWVPGQVINFSAAIAAQLIIHAVFELADASSSADTYLGNGRRVAYSPDEEPIAYVNLESMDAAQLDAYSRLNFNRGIDTTRDVGELRSLVLSYMTNKTLDDEADKKEKETSKEGNLMLEFEVTPIEYEAVQAGELVLKLVPPFVPQLIVEQPSQEELQSIQAAGLQPRSLQVLPETEETTTDTPAAETKEETKVDGEFPTLGELLAKLENPGLLKMAKENGVKVSNTMTAEVLREKLLAALNK